MFSEGLASVQDPETLNWGYINRQGNWVFGGPIFDCTYSFDKRGIAQVSLLNRSMFDKNFINKQGQVVG